MNGLVGFALVALLVGLPVGTAVGQQPSQQQPPAQQPPSPPERATGSTGDQTGAQAGLTVASDSLVGTKVRDAQGKEVGQISKLLIDARQGKVASAIIRQGGTLGLGGKEIAVPWDALTLQRGQNQELVITMQQQLLEQAPGTEPTERGRREAPATSPATGAPQERK